MSEELRLVEKMKIKVGDLIKLRKPVAHEWMRTDAFITYKMPDKTEGKYKTSHKPIMVLDIVTNHPSNYNCRVVCLIGKDKCKFRFRTEKTFNSYFDVVSL